MYVHLKFLEWPSQEMCRTNMPQVFKDLYPPTHCIIDCSEIFIERPCSYQARTQTCSNYKKRNTVKIGITPCCAISYLSKCWSGRATDKCITMNSDFLRLLDNGDVVLAHRGFDIGGARIALFEGAKEVNTTKVGEICFSPLRNVSCNGVECGLIFITFPSLLCTSPTCTSQLVEIEYSQPEMAQSEIGQRNVDLTLYVCVLRYELTLQQVSFHLHK